MESRQPPRKRLKLTHSNQLDGIRDNERERKDRRLKASFEAIFEKYGRDFTDVSDIVDLETGKVVVDNGHIKSMRNEQDIASRIVSWPLQKLTLNAEEAAEDSEDELASPAITVRARTPSDSIVVRKPSDRCESSPSSGGRSAKVDAQPVHADAPGLGQSPFPLQPNDLAKAFSNSFASLAGSKSHQQRWNSIDFNAIQQFGQNFALEVAQLVAARSTSHGYIEPAWRTPVSLHPLGHIGNMQMQAVQPSQQQPIAPLDTDAYEKGTGACAFSRVRSISRSPERQSLWAPPNRDSSSKDICAQQHAPPSRHRFSSEEDEKLLNLAKIRSLTWKKISDHFPDRSFGSVRTRWEKHLKKKALECRCRRVQWSHEEEDLLVNLKEHCGLSWAQIQSYFPGRRKLNIINHYNLRTRATPGRTARRTGASTLARRILKSTNKSDKAGPSFEAPMNRTVPYVMIESNQVQLDINNQAKLADKTIKLRGVVQAGSMCQAPTECQNAISNHEEVLATAFKQATPDARTLRKLQRESILRDRVSTSIKIQTTKSNSSQTSLKVYKDTKKVIEEVSSKLYCARKRQQTPPNIVPNTLLTPISIAAQRKMRMIRDAGPGLLVEIANSSDSDLSGVATPRSAKNFSVDKMSPVPIQKIDLLSAHKMKLSKSSKTGKRGPRSLKSGPLSARTVNQSTFSHKLAEENLGSDDELAH